MIKQCDVRVGLTSLGASSVDLIVSDIAYSTISGGKGGVRDRPSGVLTNNDGKGGFANNETPIGEYAWLLYQVLRSPGHCYIMSNLKNLFYIRDTMLRAGFKLHNLLVWKKNTANPNRWYMIDREFILFFRKGPAFSINEPGTKSIFEVDNIVGGRCHPAQKPIELMVTLIRNSSQPGDIVLDPMMGSGTTGVAAMLYGRRFIGFENDPEYIAVAKRRLGEVRV